MQINDILGTIMSGDSVKAIGSLTETDAGSVKKVLSAALPSLLQGAKEQGEDETTGFSEALLSHGKDDASDVASFLGKVDLKDGGKIIGHLLGSGSSDKIGAIAKEAGVTKKKTSNILSAAAPLLLSLLGKKASSENSSGNAALGGIAALLLKNVDLGSVLGSVLGGSGKDDKDDKDDKDEKDEKEGGGALGLLGNLLGGSGKNDKDEKDDKDDKDKKDKKDVLSGLLNLLK